MLQDWTVNGFFYITDVDNLLSICEHGILSHNEIESRNIEHYSVADENVQELREDKVVDISGLPLHDYANLYINPRNPTMFEVKNEDICVLGIRWDVALIKGAIVTDGNAASNETRFYQSPEGFDDIGDQRLKYILNTRNWRKGGSREKYLKRVLNAELLVPQRVPPEYIDRVYTKDQDDESRVMELLPDDCCIKIVKEYPDIFFLKEE